MTLITDLAVAANTLVCGASEGIGLALCSQLLARDDVRQVFAVSRQANHSAGLEALARQHGRRLIRINCDARYE
ncbi:short chain dehydrogenase [compost metagenome]